MANTFVLSYHPFCKLQCWFPVLFSTSPKADKVCQLSTHFFGSFFSVGVIQRWRFSSAFCVLFGGYYFPLGHYTWVLLENYSSSSFLWGPALTWAWQALANLNSTLKSVRNLGLIFLTWDEWHRSSVIKCSLFLSLFLSLFFLFCRFVFP